MGTNLDKSNGDADTKTFRQGIKISLVQQIACLGLSALNLDAGLLFRRIISGAIVYWVGILLCAALSHRRTWNEVHGYYFAKWCFVIIAAVIFARTIVGR